MWLINLPVAARQRPQALCLDGGKAMLDSTTIPDGYKRCNKCKVVKPTSEFYPERRYKNSFNPNCKACCSLKRKEYCAKHKAEIAAYNKASYAKNAERNRKASRKYYNDHHEELLKKNKEWRDAHPNEMAKYKDDWAKRHPDRKSQSQLKYVKAHPEKNRAIQNRRRARQLNLPDTFTGDDYLRSVEYFHGVCAYCGNPPSYLDVNWVLHADHYIPIADPNCPGSIKENMLPVCQDCNLKKNRRHPHEWLISRFGKRKAAKIEKRIAEYFASISTKDQP